MIWSPKVDSDGFRASRSHPSPTFRTLAALKTPLRAPCGARHKVLLPLSSKLDVGADFWRCNHYILAYFQCQTAGRGMMGAEYNCGKRRCGGRSGKTRNAWERAHRPQPGDGKAQQRQARQNEKRLGTGTSAAARRQEGAAAIKRRKEQQKCTISIRLQTGGGRIR